MVNRSASRLGAIQTRRLSRLPTTNRPSRVIRTNRPCRGAPRGLPWAQPALRSARRWTDAPQSSRSARPPIERRDTTRPVPSLGMRPFRRRGGRSCPSSRAQPALRRRRREPDPPLPFHRPSGCFRWVRSGVICPDAERRRMSSTCWERLDIGTYVLIAYAQAARSDPSACLGRHSIGPGVVPRHHHARGRGARQPGAHPHAPVGGRPAGGAPPASGPDESTHSISTD